MTIAVGDQVPSVSLFHFVDGKVAILRSDELLSGKRTVVFAVPGAFTSTCSERHLPGFVNNAYTFRKKGIEQVVCISVNDAFVMRAWQQDQAILDEVVMVADGNGEFTKAIGLTLDLRAVGMGVRSRRYAMVVDDGVVTHLLVEPTGGGRAVSRAEAVLEALA